MGTKVQFKSYIPIHNVIRSRNEHSSSSWSWYYQDNVLSDHLFDGSFLREENGYSLCDKEMLKRTILEHEATFTKQVSELHRLYRIQKELMNELKNREKFRLCSTFQTNFFTSQMLCKASEELRQMPHLSVLSSHASTVNAMELPLKHLKETGKRYFQMPLETSSLPRKKFDLHLPAEAYIDNDDEAIMEKQNNPCLRVDGDINGSLRLHIHHENVSSRVVLADLNEPLKPSSYEEGEDLTFPQVIGSKLENEEINRHQLHSNRSSLSKDFFLGNYGQKQTVSDSVNLDKVERLQEWPSSANASGEILSTANGSHGELCGGEFSVISQLEKEQPKNCDEFVLPSDCTSNLANLNSYECAPPQIPHPFASFSHFDNSSISSPSISSWRIDGNLKKRTKVVLSSCQNDFHQDLKDSIIFPTQTCLPLIIGEKCSQTNCIEDIEQSASQLMNLMPNPNFAASSIDEQKKHKKVSTSIGSLDSSSSSHVIERNEAFCSSSGKRILQFPISDTEVEEDITECKELNCNLVTSNKEDEPQLTDGNHETLITEAADNLVAMSSSISDPSRDLTLPSNPTSFHTLDWFADFVSSTEERTGIFEEKSSHDDVDDDDDVNGLDLFEYETLKLKEVKENEFFFRQQENQNYDDTIISLLPLTRSQRKPARKRRQRRDFQKDILPGLASLSRHEVSEDLQNFGGIMRASGESWKTGLSRRSLNWKAASNGQGRGRRRPRSLAITVTEIKIGSSQKEDTNSKQEIFTTGILGWGRTTRRCCRRKLLPGNLSVSLT